VAISQHGTSVLFTSHPKDGLVVNLYIPHNRRIPLQAEEALGPISMPPGSRGVGPFQKTSASRTEKPGAYSIPCTPLRWVDFLTNMASHTDGYKQILHIVNTFRVTHLHTQLMKVCITWSAKVILNLVPSLVRPIPLKPEPVCN
jgi:hypothetical protein